MNNFVDSTIEHLNKIEVDGETMQYIIDGTYMREQMLRQLMMLASDQEINSILSERSELHDKGNNSHLIN
jgi:hypothetical protein